MTSSQIIPDQYFNLGPLFEMVNGDTSLLSNLLMIFIKDANSTREALAKAILEADYVSIKELAHGLKGIVSVLEMIQVQDWTVQIEALALEKTGLDEIKTHFQMVDQVLSVVTEKLEAYLKEL